MRGPGDFSERRFAGSLRRSQVKALRDFSSRRFAGSREKRSGERPERGAGSARSGASLLVLRRMAPRSDRRRTNCTWSSRGGRLPSGDGTARPSRLLPASGARKPRSRHSRVKPSLAAMRLRGLVARVREQLEALDAELAEGPGDDEARRPQGYAPAARLPLDPVADLGGLALGEAVQADAAEQLVAGGVGHGQPGALAEQQAVARIGDERLGVLEPVGSGQPEDPVGDVRVVTSGLHGRSIVGLEGPDERAGRPSAAASRGRRARPRRPRVPRPRVAGHEREQHVVHALVPDRHRPAQHALEPVAGRHGRAPRGDVARRRRGSRCAPAPGRRGPSR